MSSQLNPATLSHLKQQHPAPERFAAFEATCQRPTRQAIRISPDNLETISQWANSHNWQLTQVPWSNLGYWIETNDERSLGNHIGHLAGHFYIQEATSMLPVAVLLQDHQPNYVLDMAAAPGSKTTQLAQMMSHGLMVANDMSSSRTKMLNANLIRMGVSEYSLLNQDASRLPEVFHGQFDSILLDAPCGGEGTIRKDPKAWNNWSLESLQTLTEVQRSLITHAWSLLKPGGRLVYSTCSLSREENQHIIEHLAEHAGDEMSIRNLDRLFPEASTYSDNGMLHIWPEVMDTEGFFVACLEKAGNSDRPIESTLTQSSEQPSSKQQKIILDYYLNHYGIYLTSHAHRFKATNQGNKTNIWILPQATIQEARFQRQGIHLCTLIEGRKGVVINTHHDFARCYGHLAKTNILSLSPEDTAHYFQGKNLSLEQAEVSDEVLLFFAERPIGLGKHLKGGQIKNQLPRELVHDRAWA